MKDSRSSKEAMSDVKDTMKEFGKFIEGGGLRKLKGNKSALKAIFDFREHLHTQEA